tara:strand:+ start:1599 stop:1943 length:345 start_codon:yes stop_codon:yes gene_type:complete
LRWLSSFNRTLCQSTTAAVTQNPHSIAKLPALSSLSDLSPLQLTLTAATNLRQKRPFAASAQKSALGLLYAMKTDVFEMPQKEFKGPLPNLLMLDAIQVLGFAAVTIGGFVHYL